MKSQEAYQLVFCDYPDIVNVEQMCEMLGGISHQKFCGWPPLSYTENLHF